MKILYVVHQFYPESSAGTEHFLFNLAESMQRTGHRVEVVTYSMENTSRFERVGTVLARAYFHERIPVMAIRNSKLSLKGNTAVTDPEVAAFARKHLSKGKYDLVHVVHPMRMMDCATVAGELHIPYVVTLTDFWTLCPKITLQTSYGGLCTGPEEGLACNRLCPELSNGWVKARLGAIHKMLSGAKAVIAPSQFAANMVQKEFRDLPVTVVPHGLPATGLSRQEKHYDTGAKLTFGYCGGLAPHKGVHLLINAFRNLNVGNVLLKIYGAARVSDQAYADQLHETAAGDGRIVFCGKYDVEDIDRVLKNVDVLVAPSLWYETYSFTLHEAFASQIPVIASAVGVLAENIIEGENGLTFARGDEIALASKLKLLIENPQLLNRMKGNLKRLTVPLQEEEAYLYERVYSKAAAGQRAAMTW